MSGLVVDDKIVSVDGVSIIGPHEEAWAYLSPGDCTARDGWPFQWFLHKTIADDPERVQPGLGPSGDAGGARLTAEMWQQDGKHSGAHLITGYDGETACLADLVRIEAYHATISNRYSVGHETKEQPGGVVYQGQLYAAIAVCLAGCRALGIQYQAPRLPYLGKPLRRFADGGRDLIGIFGHRDNTSDRGRWDPGDTVFGLLAARGVMLWDFDAGEDLAFWKPVQSDLTARGLYAGPIDGIPGRGTTAALKADGYIDGILALGKG